MVHLAPARRLRRRRLLDQRLDLASGFAGDGVDPRKSKPFAVPLDRPVVVAEGKIADHAVRIDDEGDVAHGGDQRGRHFGVEVTDRISGKSEPHHLWRAPLPGVITSLGTLDTTPPNAWMSAHSTTHL